MKKGTAGRVVHLTASVIFLLLSLAAFVLYAVMFTEFVSALAVRGELEGTSEQLGNGLSVAFALIFMIIFGGADLVLSAISTALGSTVIKYRTGTARKYGIVATVLSVLFLLGTLISFIVAVIMNGAA